MENQEIISAVRKNDIELIRFLYTDNDGIIRGYCTTPGELEKDLEAGHAFASAMPFFSCLDDLTPDTRYRCTGEISGLPDKQTFRLIPYAEKSALLICDFVDKTTLIPTEQCARSLLKSYLQGLKLDVMTAFENEFYLLKRDESGRLTPSDQALCFSPQAMNQHEQVVHDIIRSLTAQGIEVEKYYPEYGPGQMEIVYKYDHALKSADNQIFFRETCRGVAQKHGLVASFMPKPFQDQAGSGAHMHFSLWQNQKNIFFDADAENGISDQCRYFIGGILHHIKALCAFTAATVNSYKRLLPHSWASAYACWGIDNREAAVRVMSGMHGTPGSSFNIEYKPADAAGNPYLAKLTVLAAGMDGISNKIEPGPGIGGDPHDLPEKDRLKHGIQRLPQTLAEASHALQEDNFFRDLLGDVFIEEYLSLKRFAWENYINQVSTWEVKAYADIF